MKKATLEHLLSPMGLETFAHDIWETKHLHIPRADSNYYDHILTLEDLDEYLSRNDIRYPSLRMIRGGKPIPISDFSRPLRFGSYASEGLVDVDRVYQLYQDGASLVLQLMRSSIKSVSLFANRLQRDVSFNVETTIYLTPPSEQGFTTHYDTHSVMVLQIAGRKRWRLYDFAKTYPLLSDTFDSVKYSAASPSHDILLAPGDMLYVPRGLAHDAIASKDSKSVHITVGLFPPMWGDLFETRLRQLRSDVNFRRAPVDFFMPQMRARFIAQCEQMCQNAFGTTKVGNLFAATLRQHLTKQSRMTEHWLANSFVKLPLHASTTLRSRRSIVWQVVQDARAVSVYFYDKRLVLPHTVKVAVDRLLSGELVLIGELQPNLSLDSSIVLANKFLEAGLVEIAPGSDPIF